MDPAVESAASDLLATGVPGVVMLAEKPDSAPLRISQGIDDIETKTPIESDLMFNVASISKTFTAVVVLKLVEDGKLALDDRLESVLPGTLAYGDDVTIRQLLSHTSGVPEYWDSEVELEACLNEDKCEATAEENVTKASGSDRGATGQFSYSNTNYVLLGLVVEKITGKSFADAVTAEIIEPLGLDDTVYVTDWSKPPTNLAHGYVPYNGDLVDITDSNPFAGNNDGGNLLSTAADLTTFLQALVGGKLLDDATLKEMLTPGAGGGSVSGVETSGYGLGIQVDDGWVGHSGRTVGYSTDAFITRDGKSSVVTMTNASEIEGQDAAMAELLGAAKTWTG